MTIELILLVLAVLLAALLLTRLPLRQLYRDARGVVDFSTTIGSDYGMGSVSGPVVDATRMRIVFGRLTLVAGTAAEVLSVEQAIGFNNDPPMSITRIAPAGAVGHLDANYVAATRTLTVTSSSATETSEILYVLFAPVA